MRESLAKDLPLSDSKRYEEEKEAPDKTWPSVRRCDEMFRGTAQRAKKTRR